MKYTDFGNGVFTVDNFFSQKECKDWISKSEEIGYEEAKVGFGRKQVLMKEVRNNERLIYDNDDLALQLWNSIKEFVPKETYLGLAMGLNERFRFYKYFPDQEFKPHQDGSFIRNIHEWSSFTFMVYLNEDMTGGETKFNTLSIKPATGKALIFRHELVHQGCKVIEGIKYVLRTDVMYRRKEKIKNKTVRNNKG